MMSGRWEESPELFEEAKSKGIELSELDLRWFGIRMVQRAVEEVEKLQSPTKVLVCSTRKGPSEDYLHLKALSRLPIVITMNPDAITWGITLLDEEVVRDFELEMPDEVEGKLNKLDFVRRTWDAQGFSMDEIEASGAQINNLRSFSDAMSKIEEIFTK
jgi:transaldolase